MLKYILISFLIITNAYAYTCEEMGYTKSIADCPDGGLKCPAEPEKMFCCDRCGNAGGYRYTTGNCSPDEGLQLAGVECGGKWTECRQCTSEYKYNKDNCRSPKILAGVQCGNAYTQCVYPVGTGCIPTVGYIYYSDGSCHADYDDTKTPIGIIVDAARKTIIALDEEKQPWNDGGVLKDIPNLTSIGPREDAILDMDGKANTDIILAFVNETGQEYMAVQYCTNKKTGNKIWYLPALGELHFLHSNLNNIQTAIESIPTATKFKLEDWLYSSTENGHSTAWEYRLSDGYTFMVNKGFPVKTRCFGYF